MPPFSKPSFFHTKQLSIAPLLPNSIQQEKELSSPSSPTSSCSSSKRSLRLPSGLKKLALLLFVLAGLGIVGSQFLTLQVKIGWVGQELSTIEFESSTAVGKKVVSESAPHAMMRDSFLPGLKYATTAPSAGFNNQLISYIELLRYSQLANRVPILGDYVAYPIIRTYPHPPAPQISFDTVFDLGRYQKLASQQVTTFAQLKLPSSPPELLSCLQTSTRQGHSPVKGLVNAGELGVEWTAHPSIDMDVWESPYVQPFGHAVRVEELVKVSEAKKGVWNSWVDGVVERMGEEDRKGVMARPEQDLLCWSDMYWAAEHDNVFNERWNTDWSAWETAGKHLRFAPPLERQASEYLKYIMDGDRPFIAIHARHGDFGCPELATSDPSRPPSSSSCFRSPSSYIPTVSHLITALSELKDVSISPRDVILFSDEEDEAWWAEVSELGWKRVDHRLLGTKERWDNWYPTLIDMVLMSKAKGFIGTQGSTYSLLAALRVRDWNNGMTAQESR